jgi:cephalosporin hydroxylase
MAGSWKDYFATVKPKLGNRRDGFQKIFDYLDTIKRPIIVETGTYREQDNYTGDGCSTLLFDNYVKYHGGSLVSIDIDPKACELAETNTKWAEVICGDSVETLSELDGKADLLYLDSFNIHNWLDDWAPAAHHLKELFAAKNILKEGTLIVVDDNIIDNFGRRLGKGRLIYELMEALDISTYIDEYQVAWIWSEVWFSALQCKDFPLCKR